MNKKLLSIAFPTNNPNSFHKYFLKSFHHLLSLKATIEINVCCVFQPPWTNNTINEVVLKLKEMGCKLTYIFLVPMDKIPRMIHLRELSLALSPDSDYFLVIDDNLEFKSKIAKRKQDSGIRYSQCIKYLEKYKDCGLVQCESVMGGFRQKFNIQSSRSPYFWTARGLILRNIGIKKMFRNTSTFVGGGEEPVITYHIIENGFYPAKQFYSPTAHKREHHNVDFSSNSIDEDAGLGSAINDLKIMYKNNFKYIRERYNDPTWELFKRWPKDLKKMYLQNNGNPEYFKKYINIMEF